MQKFFMRTTKTDQTARMRKLVCVLVGLTYQKVRFLTLTDYLIVAFASNGLAEQTLMIGGYLLEGVKSFYT